MLGFETLTLSETQLQNYALYEIEQILNKNDKTLKDFPTMPFLDLTLIRECNNRLLAEELDYDRQALSNEHHGLHSGLNA